MAVSTVYQSSMVEGADLSSDYIQAGYELSMKRIHAGGLRLAAFIDKAFKARSQLTDEPEKEEGCSRSHDTSQRTASKFGSVRLSRAYNKN